MDFISKEGFYWAHKGNGFVPFDLQAIEKCKRSQPFIGFVLTVCDLPLRATTKSSLFALRAADSLE